MLDAAVEGSGLGAAGRELNGHLCTFGSMHSSQYGPMLHVLQFPVQWMQKEFAWQCRQSRCSDCECQSIAHDWHRGITGKLRLVEGRGSISISSSLSSVNITLPCGVPWRVLTSFVFSPDRRGGGCDLLVPEDDFDRLRKCAPGSRLSFRLMFRPEVACRVSCRTVSRVPSLAAATMVASIRRLVARSGEAPGAPSVAAAPAGDEWAA